MNERLMSTLQKVVHSQAQISLTLTLLLLALSAWLVGQTIWSFSNSSPSTTVIPWQANISNTNGIQPLPQHSNDIDPLLNAHLFGRYNETKSVEPVKTVIVDAPKTKLSLVLVGIVASNNPETSLAVISQRGTQNTYAIDEKIDGTEAILKAVFVDRVIIENAGKNETLMLEGLEYKRLEIAEPTPQALELNVQGNNPQSAEEKLENIKNELINNPQQIFQYVRFSQVKQDDNIKGYRISPGKDPQWFEAIGLQNNDIATHINGIDVTTPTAMTQILAMANELTELNLTVERDGQPYEIVIKF